MILKKYKVLVVEDEVELLTLLKERLEISGFDVLCAENNVAAREKLRNEKFSIIILDIGLSENSGLKIIDSIRENLNSLNKTTPIFIHSGNIAPEVIHKYKDQVSEFFAKPINYDHLIKKVQEWCKK